MNQQVVVKSAHTLAWFIVLIVYISCVAPSHATDQQAVGVTEVEKSTISLTTDEKKWNKNKWSLTSGTESSTQVLLSAEEQAWLKAHPDIRLGAPTSYPPLVIKNAKRPHTGMLVDLFELINQRLNTNIQLHIEDSWPSVLEKAKNKTIDGLASGGRSASREDHLNPTDTLFSTYYYIFARTNDQLLLKSVDDLKGMRIGYKKSDTPVKSLLDRYTDVTPVPYSDNVAMTKGLMNTEVDVLVAWISYDFWRRDKLQGAVDNILLATDTPLNMYIHIRKDWPELIPILNKALVSIHENEMPKIMDKWFIERPRLPGTLKTHLTKKEQIWLEEKQTIRVRITKIPPYIIPKKDGEPEGIAIDYLKLISDRTGVEFEYSSSGKPFSEALDGLKKHQGPDLISTIVSTPERQKTVAFSREYLKSPTVIFIRADNKKNIYGMDDILDKKVALQKGSALHKIVASDYPDINLMAFDFDIQAIEAVSSGVADAYIGNLMLTSYLILDKGLYNLKIAAPTPFDDQRFSMGIRNDWPELATIIDKGLATITTIEQDEIRNRYISVRYDQHNTSLILKWILIVTASALGIILLFFLWNRSLKKQVATRTSELKSSEDRFSLAMEAAQDGIYDWNLLENTIYFSPGWKRMLGYKNSELPNDFSVWEKLTNPQDVRQAWQMQNELITKKRDRFEIEFKMKHKDGHWVDILSRASAIFDDNGAAVRIIGTHVDITERKQSQKKLIDVLQFNEKIISESPVGLTIYEADSGRCIAANDSIAKLIGGTKEAVLSQNIYELESWKKSGLLMMAKEILEKKISKRKTLEVTSTFGKTIAIDCYMTQFSFGEKQHLFLTSTDVTQKFKDEKTIIRQREEAERYLNLAGVMFVGLDKGGNINLANKKACQILEVQQEDVLGQNWFDNFIPQDRRHEIHSVFQQIIDGDLEPFEYHENSVVSKTGREKYIAWQNTALKNEEGNIIGILSSGEDITEKKHLRLKLQQAQKMESIGTLAGGIAHDFNNILSSILGFSELALSGVEKGSEIEDDLQEVLMAGMRAKDLVQQILTFARQSDETVKPIQVKTIAKEAIKFLKSSIPASVQIEEKINSDSFIMGSPTQVHQILMNLCTNASQAMEANGGILEVSVEDVTIKKSTQISDLNSGEYIKINVKDTGIGISAKNITTIFEPYFTTKKVGEGTGMGLAVVHGIVESYGGKTTVNSSIKDGSTFSVYLPITKKRRKHTSSEKTALPSGNEHILFVDDEVALAKMGSRTLEQLGYAVTVRTSSIEALELFRSNPKDFHLVVTDMTMPNLTGNKLAVELMKIRPDIPVVLCTGYSKTISERNALDLGIKAFVYKPIAKADLAKTVRNVLDEA